MSPRSNTIFERFLAPVFRTFLIDQDEIQRLYQEIDWEAASQRLTNPALTYPDYYKEQNFHGIQGGYLTIDAAVSYDPITHYVLPPSEHLVRQVLLDAIQTQPRRILDMGCGTGSTTLMLKQKFPDSEVIGLDLSPYMLVMAEYKAHKTRVDIQWRHGQAERTGFPNASFDLVTASLLFHETPVAIAKAILRESFRLLTVGGEVLIFDGNQRSLRHADWLTNIFEEPYIQEYAAGRVDAWMGATGFGAVYTQDVWLLHQLTRGVKPLSQSVKFSTFEQREVGKVNGIFAGYAAPQ
ncbi:methylase involved in ubiquinone/menaquinone biosynthesis [Leptolyngbyaceae cyanobacterium JSC-12]|nr:methylase involved in ubiquinone/menaquinone biosynthesis [Leptolyngbyaceae cyanobacterium JSC-12]